jgi:sugar phosphate isomerase/epimerase
MVIFMVKLAFSTLPCEGWTVEKIIQYCKQYGFTGIELREGDDSIVSISKEKEEIEDSARLFREAGIEVTDIGSSICVKGNSEDEIKKAIQILQQVVQIAKQLSAKGVRIFLGNFARRNDAQKDELNYNRIVEFIKIACDYGKLYNIEIWIETHNEFATGKVLRKLLDDVDRENCKIIWDIIHPLEDGESPSETLELIGRQCAHVHIKDGRPFDDSMQHDWEYTFIGHGDVPIRRIVELLLNHGYQGYFSLEWESKWRDELKVPGTEPEIILPFYAEYMKKLLFGYVKQNHSRLLL